MAARGKHYTAVDKKVFLEILKEHKDVIEAKKSDSATLRQKEAAWTAIAVQFNSVLQISQERTVPQLKKLWTNMKHGQREALTKERQSRMATGGGPEGPVAEVDPDISAIVPHLMELAPTNFSSNLDDVAIGCTNINHEDEEDSEEYLNIEYLEEPTPANSELLPQASSSSSLDTPTPLCKRICVEEKRKRSMSISKSHSKLESATSLDNVIAERIKNLVNQDKELFEMKKQHTMKMQQLEVSHFQITSRLKDEHLLEIHGLELRKAKAEAELAEVELKHKKSVHNISD